MLLVNGIAALAAKIAGASAVAQAATGLTVAVAGVTGAGAAGVLPGPVQDGVAHTIEAVTPFDLPDSGGVHHGTPVVIPAAPATRTDSTTTSAAPTSEVPARETDAAAETDGTRTTETEAHSTEAEHGQASEDHGQHRGRGSAPAAPSATTDRARPHGDDATSGHSGSDSTTVRTTAPRTTEAPATEEHQSGGSGSGSGSGSHHGSDG